MNDDFVLQRFLINNRYKNIALTFSNVNRINDTSKILKFRKEAFVQQKHI